MLEWRRFMFLVKEYVRLILYNYFFPNLFMKLYQILIPSFFILLLFGSFGYFSYRVYFVNDLVEEQISNHLITVAESKAERVKYFLDESKKDLEFLVSSNDIFSILEDPDSVNYDEIRDFQLNNDYLDIILMDLDGIVLYSGENKNLIGNDISNDESKLAEIFNKVQNDFGVGIFDPGYFGDEDKLSVFVTSPVLVDSEIPNKKDMIGILALQIDNKKIEEKIEEDVGFGDLGEIYLVNRDGTFITKPEGSFGISSIDTEMYRDCFDDYDNYYFEKAGLSVVPVEKSGIYRNYIKNLVYGAHQYMLQTGWCVMVEVDQGDFYNLVFQSEKTKYLNFLYLFSFLFLFFSILILILDRYINISGVRR